VLPAFACGEDCADSRKREGWKSLDGAVAGSDLYPVAILPEP